jgi:hypothetical protein
LLVIFVSLDYQWNFLIIYFYFIITNLDLFVSVLIIFNYLIVIILMKFFILIVFYIFSINRFMFNYVILIIEGDLFFVIFYNLCLFRFIFMCLQWIILHLFIIHVLVMMKFNLFDIIFVILIHLFTFLTLIIF